MTLFQMKLFIQPFRIIVTIPILNYTEAFENVPKYAAKSILPKKSRQKSNLPIKSLLEFFHPDSTNYRQRGHE